MFHRLLVKTCQIHHQRFNQEKIMRNHHFLLRMARGYHDLLYQEFHELKNYFFRVTSCCFAVR